MHVLMDRQIERYYKFIYYTIFRPMSAVLFELFDRNTYA